MLNYRTAQTADLPAMMKMVEEAKEGFRARNIDQWQKGEPNEQGLTEGIEKSVVHVLEENGEVLGMITVVPGPEADYAVIDGAWLNDEPYFAFHRVCVSEAHKGKGLAASLFSYSEAFAKEKGDQPPVELAGHKVVKVTDYKKPEETGLPAANVLIYTLENGATVVVRPSGTEPKIKTYFTTLGKDLAEAQAQKDALAAAIEPILK